MSKVFAPKGKTLYTLIKELEILKEKKNAFIDAMTMLEQDPGSRVAHSIIEKEMKAVAAEIEAMGQTMYAPVPDISTTFRGQESE